MTVTQMDQDAPAPGEYAALLAVLERIGQSPLPITLWSLSNAGLTAAELKTALHGLATRGCLRASYRAGLPDAVMEVHPEAGRLAAAWTAGWS